MSDTIPTINARDAIKGLQSGECHCGRTKRPGMSHCRQCYFSLPEAMRKALYRLVGEGYEQAYTESITWLAEHRTAKENT